MEPEGSFSARSTIGTGVPSGTVTPKVPEWRENSLRFSTSTSSDAAPGAQRSSEVPGEARAIAGGATTDSITRP